MNTDTATKSWGLISPDATLGDRILKVDHAGEHGAVNIYRGQRHAFVFRWSQDKSRLLEFQSHEEQHRALFLAELNDRGAKQCPSYHLCGFGGYILGFTTGLLGKSAIAATTYAVEHVVLQHLDEQLAALKTVDVKACETITKILDEEQKHHDEGFRGFKTDGLWSKTLVPFRCNVDRSDYLARNETLDPFILRRTLSRIALTRVSDSESVLILHRPERVYEGQVGAVLWQSVDAIGVIFFGSGCPWTGFCESRQEDNQPDDLTA